jgi:hypothetical protein
MLSPDDRILLSDALISPPGYRLEHALATSFTLDLTALLTVPLGFAGIDLVANGNEMALLQAVREYADRIDVFSQRGMLKVPTKPNSLLAFLEEMIHPVGPPRPGYLFHPKIWVLRFRPSGADVEDSDRFRLVCGSRNLTFDRSWDAAVILDGVETNRRFACNNPLGGFLRSLPDRAGGVGEARQARLDETLSRLNNVEWERPEGAIDGKDWLKFHVFGPTASGTPEKWGRRILVVSPFLNSGGLRQFEDCESLHVISRSEQFDSLPIEDRDWLSDPVPSLFTLDDDAAIRDLEDEESGVRWDLTGLHAKFYAFERGHYTHIMIGSANATDAAWSGNDEFLVEIVGKRKVVGIDTLIVDESPFRKILIEHTFGEPEQVEPDEDLRRTLENLLRGISEHEFHATISGSDEEGWIETVRTTAPISIGIPDVAMHLSLVSRPSDRHVSQSGTPIDSSWTLIGLEEATPFVVVELRSGPVAVSSIVLAKLEGGPPDRIDRVLARQFEDPETFLRFVALLLALAGEEGGDDAGALLAGFGEVSGEWTSSGSGLLEALLRALSRSPRSVDDVERLVRRLQATEDGRRTLPDGWDQLWDAVRMARQALEDDL